MEATIVENRISVLNEENCDGKIWLKIGIPDGQYPWNYVKNYTNKVLSYQGKLFVFMSWNSDSMVMNFKESNKFAIVMKK